MARTPEGKVKDKVVAILKREGVYYFFPATHGMGRSGVPDIICCVAGRFLAIECKAGNGKTTLLQDRELHAIQSVGGVALVINEESLTTVENTVHKLKLKGLEHGHV
jgi:Holliday junction resolvase